MVRVSGPGERAARSKNGPRVRDPRAPPTAAPRPKTTPHDPTAPPSVRADNGQDNTSRAWRQSTREGRGGPPDVAEKAHAELLGRMMAHEPTKKMALDAITERDKVKSIAILVRAVAEKTTPFTMDECVDLVDTIKAVVPPVPLAVALLHNQTAT